MSCDNTVQILSIPDVEALIEKANKLKLDGREIIDKYTIEEIRQIFNGIGPDRFPKWLRNFLSEINEIILPAALIHDLDYDFGGSMKDFYASNSRLGKNSMICVRDAYGRGSIKYWFYLAKISIFVKICNKYGKPGWNFKSC